MALVVGAVPPSAASQAEELVVGAVLFPPAAIQAEELSAGAVSDSSKSQAEVRAVPSPAVQAKVDVVPPPAVSQADTQSLENQGLKNQVKEDLVKRSWIQVVSRPCLS